MSIKPEVRETCKFCGEVNARIEGEYIVEIGHDCKSMPPGPPNFPRRHHRRNVTFLTKTGEAVHHDIDKHGGE